MESSPGSEVHAIGRGDVGGFCPRRPPRQIGGQHRTRHQRENNDRQLVSMREYSHMAAPQPTGRARL